MRLDSAIEAERGHGTRGGCALGLAAFQPAARERVAALAGNDPALADLATTFPALLFALSTNYGLARTRQATITHIVRGTPLRASASVLGIPWWMRKLPAEAFVDPLPPLPCDQELERRIVDLLPAQATDASAWLWAVLYGAQACGPQFALWIAAMATRQPRLLRRPASRELVRHLAAWAWHAGAEGTLGHAMLSRPWTPDVGLRRAADEVARWRRRLALHACLGDGIADVWLGEGPVDGLDFVALRTAADLVTEAERMDNCLDHYAERLEEGRSRVFSIRREGIPVADVEIGIDRSGAQMPVLVQLRGPRNRRAAPAVWRAAYGWLAAQPLKPIVASRLCRDAKIRRRVVAEVWRPYLDWMGRCPARAELVAMLARETGVTIQPSTRSQAGRLVSPAHSVLPVTSDAGAALEEHACVR